MLEASWGAGAYQQCHPVKPGADGHRMLIPSQGGDPGGDQGSPGAATVTGTPWPGREPTSESPDLRSDSLALPAGAGKEAAAGAPRGWYREIRKTQEDVNTGTPLPHAHCGPRWGRGSWPREPRCPPPPLRTEKFPEPAQPGLGPDPQDRAAALGFPPWALGPPGTWRRGRTHCLGLHTRGGLPGTEGPGGSGRGPTREGLTVSSGPLP